MVQETPPSEEVLAVEHRSIPTRLIGRGNLRNVSEAGGLFNVTNKTEVRQSSQSNVKRLVEGQVL